MRYILKDYRYFFKNEKGIFILAAICVMISTLILHFCYGLYQNKHSNGSNAPSMTNETEENWVRFEFSTEEGKQVTKADVKRCLLKVADNMDLIQSYGNSDSTLFTCYANLDWNYPMDTENVLRIILDKDGLHAPTICYDNMVSSNMADGAFWTDEDEANGAKVCMYYDYRDGRSMEMSDGKVYPNEECALNEDGTVTIEGEDYTIIGYEWWEFAPWVPFGSLKDDTIINNGYFCFTEWVTQRNFDYISQIFIDELGDDRVTVDTSCSYRKDLEYKYRTILMMIAVLAMIVTVNYMILYTYLLECRRFQTAVFRICGMARWKGNLFRLSECLLFTMPFYIIAALAYAFVIMPVIRQYFTRMQLSYSLWVYFALFGIYVGASVVVCFIGILADNHNTIVQELQ